jgi:heme oxygenase
MSLARCGAAMTRSLLAHLDRETHALHHGADADRLALRGGAISALTYRQFLSRIYGFESAVETSFALTRGLGELIELDARTHVGRLARDLIGLGITDPSELPRLHPILPFPSIADALGWMYAVDRNTAVHGRLLEQLRARIPDVLAIAGSYLADTRGGDLEQAISTYARTPSVIAQLVDAAKHAFTRQRQWYAHAAETFRRANSLTCAGYVSVQS